VINAAPPARVISWGAIFAGAVLASVVSVVLNLLGLGIGALKINPVGAGVRGLGLAAGIWLVVANLVALFIGGWAAGRLSSTRRRSEGALHGLITWGFVTIFSVYLIGNAVSALVGGTATSWRAPSRRRPRASTRRTPARRRASSAATAAPAAPGSGRRRRGRQRRGWHLDRGRRGSLARRPVRRHRRRRGHAQEPRSGCKPWRAGRLTAIPAQDLEQFSREKT